MTIASFFLRLSAALLGNALFRILLVVVCMDMLFGSLRAAREHKWNSSVGIDGGIRKVGMLAAVVMLQLCDMLIHCNVIMLVPAEMQESLAAIGLLKLGIAELFTLLFILYEATSVLKNMLLCGIPIPRGIRSRLSQWLQLMTDETNADLLAADLTPAPAPEDLADPYEFLTDPDDTFE